MTKKRKPIRQGDVILLPVDTIPAGKTQRTSRYTLAFGEVTGHSHVLEGELEVTEAARAVFVDIMSAPAIETHQEHGALTVPIGKWRVILPNQYVQGEISRALD